MIDPSDIKAGAQFVVTASAKGAWVGVNQYGFVRVDYEGGTEPIHISALSPLPTPSPTAEIDAEIVEAAEALANNIRAFGNVGPKSNRLLDALDRRRALLKPKDAVGELLEAVARAQDAELPPSGSIRAIETRAWQELVEAAARARRDRGE